MTGMTFHPLTQDQQDQLSDWRARAIQVMPYFAPILFALQPVSAPGLNTFAVDDKWRLYLDFEKARSWGDAACGEILLHECGHIFRDHHDRAHNHLGDKRDDAGYRRIANVANDLEINDDLVEAGCGRIAANGVLPKHFGFDDGDAAEAYYRLLAEKAKASCGTCGQTQGQGQQSGQGQGQGQGQQSGQGQGQGQDQSQGQGSGEGQGQGQGSGQQGQSQGQGSDQGQCCPDCGQSTPVFSGCGQGGGGNPVPGSVAGQADAVTPGVDGEERDAVLMDTAIAIQDHAKTRGTVPGGLMDRAAAVLAPSAVPWQRVLGATFRRAFQSRPGKRFTTYQRRNRRRPTTAISGDVDVLNPGTIRPVPSILVIRDTSGSMSIDDLAAVTREVEGIAKKMSVRGKGLRVVDADTHLYDATEYRRAKDIETVQGRGGTDMDRAIVDAIQIGYGRRKATKNQRSLRTKPQVVVCITDGYTPWPDKADCMGVPVVACIVGDSTVSDHYAVPSWIKTVIVPTGASRRA